MLILLIFKFGKNHVIHFLFMLEKYICLYRWNIFGYEIPVKGVLFISYFDELDLIYDEIKPF